MICLTVIASDLEWPLNVISSTGNIIITVYITCDVTRVMSSEISGNFQQKISTNLF